MTVAFGRVWRTPKFVDSVRGAPQETHVTGSCKMKPSWLWHQHVYCPEKKQHRVLGPRTSPRLMFLGVLRPLSLSLHNVYLPELTCSRGGFNYSGTIYGSLLRRGATLGADFGPNKVSDYFRGGLQQMTEKWTCTHAHTISNCHPCILSAVSRDSWCQSWPELKLQVHCDTFFPLMASFSENLSSWHLCTTPTAVCVRDN